MALKRDKFDQVFSHLVRLRADWKCEYPGCGKDFPPGRGRGGLHCAHIYGRRNKSVRWEPDNAMSYCWHHHQVTGENPLDFTEMVKHTLGEARYERLTRLAWTPIKYGKAEKEELYQHLKSEVARLEQLRLDGVVGRIEVVGYE